MSASEFPLGISAVPEGHFGGGGGGTGYFAERRQPKSDDAESRHAEAEHEEKLEQDAPEPADDGFEPVYEEPGHEHYVHLGRLLDVRM
jgi:hypothetical protein